MIKKIYSKIMKIKRIIEWNFQFIKLRNICERKTINNCVHIKDERVLILAPHSDDEWIGCFSLIENNECVICSMDMKGDNDLETRTIRFFEMNDIARLYNRKIVRLADKKVDELRKIISFERPSLIAVPFFIDWHLEHIDAMNILNEALNNYNCKIIMYQVSCPLPHSSINYIVNLDRKQWKRKWSTFKRIYKTQKDFPWKRFSIIEKAEGGYSDSFASNVYCVIDGSEWKKMFTLVVNLEERKQLINNLNNIVNNYLLVEKIWKERR